MKLSEAIKTLKEIKAKFGDLKITGAYMTEDGPLREIMVTNSEGMQVWPEDPNGAGLDVHKPFEVFLTS